MELEKLRLFVALAGEKSYSAAARKLFLSHSTLSRAVSSLEDELGVKLVLTNKHSISLTPAGKALADGASDLIRSEDELKRRVRAEKS